MRDDEGARKMGRVFYGHSAPANSVGTDGDCYLSTGTKPDREAWLYGPKKGGAWGVRVSLTGREPAEVLAGPLRWYTIVGWALWWSACAGLVSRLWETNH